MPGQPGRSGGWNRLPIEAHIQRGTFRPSRHAALLPPPLAVSEAERRRALHGLTGEPRRQAGELLDLYGGWDPASLSTLRAYVLSCARRRALEEAPTEDARALHKEVDTNLKLFRALNLEGAR